MRACKLYMKHEEVPEKQLVFVYGFTYIKTDKLDIFILIGY